MPQLGASDHFFESKLRYVDSISASIRLLRTARQYWFETRSENSIFRDRLYNTESEAFQVAARTFTAFYERVLSDGAAPIIALLPPAWDVRRFEEYGTKTYAPLIAYFEEKGYQYIDVMDTFTSASGLEIDRLYVGRNGHYNATGNRAVARQLLDHLRENDLMSPTGIRRHVAQEWQRTGVRDLRDEPPQDRETILDGIGRHTR